MAKGAEMKDATSLTLSVIDLEFCPRNRSHTTVVRGKFAQIIKTEAARLYESALTFHLQKFAFQTAAFAAQFNEKKHKLQADWVYGSPDFLTATGKINLQCPDMDAHKVLQDVVMDFVGINDGYIRKESKEHVFNDRYFVQVKLTILPV
jgi:hypothetical protein